ncbi:MAG: DUF58 domain-containing protein [Candidatus Dadabacteria bacterium]
MPEDIVDVEAVLKLRGLFFHTSSRVRGLRAGIHKSLHKGISPDFMEYKEYSRGDELRHIDWRLYGRLDRLYVKKFEDEVNLDWCILIDRSGSMGYASRKDSKLDYAIRLSATLAYLLLKQGDSVGTADFSDKCVDIILPRSGTANLTHIVEKLKSLRPGGKSALKEAVLKTIERINRDSVFVLVSDFLMDLELIEESIKLIRAAGKDTIAIHVLDPDEIDFNFDGSIEFEDMEDDIKVLVEAGGFRSTYRKEVGEFIQKLRFICHENRSRYVLSPSDIPIEDALIRISDK